MLLPFEPAVADERHRGVADQDAVPTSQGLAGKHLSAQVGCVGAVAMTTEIDMGMEVGDDARA